MMRYNIVRATECHLDQIVEIEKQCFAQPWSKQSLIAELNKENAVMFVAIAEDGEALGWAGFEHIFGEGSVTNIAVLPQKRRAGVGEALTQMLIEAASGLLLDWLMLEVRNSNLPAISLYRKLGFETIGIRPDFYESPREDAVLMRHMLG